MEPNLNTIQEQVRRRFALVALDPRAEKRFEIGRTSALKLGYDASMLDLLPTIAVESFAGVGNPLSLARPTEGMTVLDLGCGSGMDALMAARLVGPEGRVIGIDMTEEMVGKAHRALTECGLKNVEIRTGIAHRLDLERESVDLIISNGVINLCPNKEQVLAELFRILRPGGRMQLADMSLVDGVNPELLERVGEWSD